MVAKLFMGEIVMSTLHCRITKRKVNGEDRYEGTLSIRGVLSTKLVKAKSNETTFSKLSDVRRAANNFVKVHDNYKEVKFEETFSSTSNNVSKNSKTVKSGSKTTSTLTSKTAVTA